MADLQKTEDVVYVEPHIFYVLFMPQDTDALKDPVTEGVEDGELSADPSARPHNKVDHEVLDVRSKAGDVVELDEQNDEIPLFHPDLAEAIKERFAKCIDEVTKYGVFLSFGGHEVEVSQNCIEVRAAFEIGDSEFDPSLMPSPEELIKELSRSINMREALRHFEYVEKGRGLAEDHYYELIMAKDMVFDSKDTLMQELDELKDALEVVDEQNARLFSIVPPARLPDGPTGLEDEDEEDLG